MNKYNTCPKHNIPLRIEGSAIWRLGYCTNCDTHYEFCKATKNDIINNKKYFCGLLMDHKEPHTSNDSFNGEWEPFKINGGIID